jgi:hypothetical protein
MVSKQLDLAVAYFRIPHIIFRATLNFGIIERAHFSLYAKADWNAFDALGMTKVGAEEVEPDWYQILLRSSS